MSKAGGIIILLIISFNAWSQTGKYGSIEGQWRNYWLSSYNKKELKDFRALATGLKLKYNLSVANHFKFSTAIYSSFNLNIQDLSIPDPQTGRTSRYALGQFDLQDPNRRLIVIPGELNISYSTTNHSMAIGRMKLKTPFINPQDGNMIPTLVQGAMYTYQNKNNFKSQAGILNKIAPRSTAGFFNIGESIGKYPVGRNNEGQKSLYAGNTNSDFILFGHLQLKATDNFKIDAWNFYTENVFNHFYLKPTLRLPNQNMSISAEWLHQDKIKNGGNRIDSLAYYQDNGADVAGIEVVASLQKTQLSVGYDHIFKRGKFLFPREWGIEQLFSFQKRERTEGSASNDAIVVQYKRNFQWKNQLFKTNLSLGRHWKPFPGNAKENKYAMPSYSQVNVDIFYQHKKINFLNPELLIIYKNATRNTPDNPNFYFNKADQWLINLIVNINF